tara:strand:+ start:274 stop:501 length:228 start_codon:yes stop_codon:yes gene_type:complete
MKHTRKIVRDFGESYETAYIFNGKYDFDAIQDYFGDKLGEYFGSFDRGPGEYWQICCVWTKGSRTIAYVNAGLDV